jgi:predicted lipoprotein with Yx(FWY)xxD motif
MRVKELARWAAAVGLAAAVAASALAAEESAKVASKDKVGDYLADAKGMALYTFKNDSPGKSACAGPCVEKWPLYQGGAGAGTKASDFGTITREDGKQQTTYKGMPLYYFAGDKAPADTNGDGVKNVWSLARP